MGTALRTTILTSLLGLSACATPPELAWPERPDSGLDPARDGFAYANELYWSYDTGVSAPASGHEADGAEIFGQRCVVMVRAARQFFYGARFEPGLPRVPDERYRELVERVLDTDPRAEAPLADPVVIPGFASLHEFSAEYEQLLKQVTSGRWLSYVQRGNWRMLFPFTASQQLSTAAALLEALARGHPPIVHVMNFPIIDVNHSLLVLRAAATREEVDFESYDPNQPERSVSLRFDRKRATFFLAPTPYFAGGPVKVYEIFDGLLF